MLRPLILMPVLLVAACAPSGDGAGSAAGGVTGNPFGEAASADPERGAVLALSCRACHTFGAGEAHLLGPNLYGLFGRLTGSAAGFEYSAALREADFLWTPQALDAWLAEPGSFLPGNSMVFAGFNSASDRSDLIAYLLRATADGAP